MLFSWVGVAEGDVEGDVEVVVVVVVVVLLGVVEGSIVVLAGVALSEGAAREKVLRSCSSSTTRVLRCSSKHSWYSDDSCASFSSAFRRSFVRSSVRSTIFLVKSSIACNFSEIGSPPYV